MDFESFEQNIKFLARRYGSSYNLIEDFEQIGRVVLCRLANSPTELERGYVLASVKNEMLGELVRLNAQKRKPVNGRVVSIEGLCNDESGMRFEPEIIDEPKIPEERLDYVYECLKKKFGEKYIHGLKNTNFPKEKAKLLIQTAIENIYRISSEDLIEKVDRNFFNSSKLLKRLLIGFFKNSYINALSEIYGEDFILYNLKQKPNNFWRGKRGFIRAKDAVRWFVSENEIENPIDCRKFGFNEFKDYQLSGMLQVCFRGSPYLAFKTYFPDLKQWETKRVPSNYFNIEDNQKNAVIDYMIGLGYSKLSDISCEEFYAENLRREFSVEDMKKNGLSSIIRRHGGVYRTFNDLFPEQTLPWTFNSREVWKDNPKETANNAIRWLIDDYLNFNSNEVPKIVTSELFWRVGFSGIMTNKRIGFNSSPYLAINAAYPGKYSQLDFYRNNTTI